MDTKVGECHDCSGPLYKEDSELLPEHGRNLILCRKCGLGHYFGLELRQFKEKVMENQSVATETPTVETLVPAEALVDEAPVESETLVAKPESPSVEAEEPKVEAPAPKREKYSRREYPSSESVLTALGPLTDSPRTAREVAEAVGHDPKETAAVLKVLVANGEVIKVGDKRGTKYTRSIG